MQLAQLLVEIRRRTRILPALNVDPLQEITQRCAVTPDTPESQTLARIATAIGHRAGQFNEGDIWSLGPEALGLLDALIERTIQGSYIGDRRNVGNELDRL